MTLDEIIYANSNDRIPDDLVDTIKVIAKSYALHIAQEAVEDFKADWGSANRESIFAVEELLSRIEELKEES